MGEWDPVAQYIHQLRIDAVDRLLFLAASCSASAAFAASALGGASTAVLAALSIPIVLFNGRLIGRELGLLRENPDLIWSSPLLIGWVLIKALIGGAKGTMRRLLIAALVLPLTLALLAITLELARRRV